MTPPIKSLTTKLFSCGSVFNKMIFPLFMAISSSTSIISYTLLKNISYEKEGTNRYFYGKPFIIAWFMCLSEATLGIFYLIEQRKATSESLSVIENEIREISKEQVTRKGKRYIIFLYSLITCLLDCISIIILCMIRELEQTFYEVDYKALLIVASTVISIFLLRYKFHFHHVIGGIIIVIGIIIYTLCDLLIPKEENTDFKDKTYREITQRVRVFAALFTLINPILTGFQENIEKYMMEKMFVSPFKICFIEGSIGFMIITLCFIPLAYIDCPDNSLLCDPRSSKGKVIENVFESLGFVGRHVEFLLMLLLIFLSFAVFNFFRVKTNFHFSPSHRAISDVFGYFVFFINQLFFKYLGYRKKNKAVFNVVAIICYIIVLVGEFIFLEIFIVHVSNIDKDTRESIEIRQELENKMITDDKHIFDLTQTIEPSMVED